MLFLPSHFLCSSVSSQGSELPFGHGVTVEQDLMTLVGVPSYLPPKVPI